MNKLPVSENPVLHPKNLYPLRLLDVEIGSRVRKYRKEANLTQKALGSKLGVKYQVVQKYEKGTTKVSVSRLLVIASVLDLDPAIFIDGLSPENLTARRTGSIDFHNSNTALEMSRAMSELTPSVQRALVNMVRELAADRN